MEQTRPIILLEIFNCFISSFSSFSAIFVILLYCVIFIIFSWKFWIKLFVLFYILKPQDATIQSLFYTLFLQDVHYFWNLNLVHLVHKKTSIPMVGNMKHPTIKKFIILLYNAKISVAIWIWMASLDAANQFFWNVLTVFKIL